MDNLGLDSALKNITEDCLKNLLPKPRTYFYVRLFDGVTNIYCYLIYLIEN